MAGFLPNDLTGVGATPTNNDVFVIQQEGSSEVKKVSYSEILGGALTSADIGTTVASLVGGTVPSSQLPSYVDDVIEANDLASFPVGESGKLYVALDTNKTYRWSGSSFVEIGSGLYASDIGVTVQGYDLNTVVDAAYVHTDTNYTAIDKTKVDFISVTGAVDLDTVLVDGDLGVNIQGYDVNTVVDASYVHTDNNFTTVLKTNYDASYTHSQSAHAPTDADNTAANETSHLNVVVDASYVHTDTNYVAGDKTKVDFISVTGAVDLDSVVKSSDIGTSVQAYNINTVVDADYASTKATINAGGDTASRPASPVLYQSYFDTDLTKPIWHDGTNWVDATGTTV